jgi:two-component system, LytTR family, sensor histidine kinase AlgZ
MTIPASRGRMAARFSLVQILIITSAGALVTPAFMFLLSDRGVGVRELGRFFVYSMVYANAIGFLANWIIPPIRPRVAHEHPIVQWGVLVLALVVIGSAGCLIGTSALTLFLASDWPGFRFAFAYSYRLCVFITVVFGLSIAAYERLQDRLANAELKLRTEELERERAIKLATEARLASLEARIHPHFLFNTLNSISSLIPADPERAERLIERMAALLRFSLDAHRGGLVPLEQELKIVRDYLEIEQARLGPRLRYEIEPGGLSVLPVPPLAIQTLVENSIKFAVAPYREGGRIRVTAHRNNGSSRIEVADTGPGFSADILPADHGLDNLRRRLAVLFGNAAELRVDRIDQWNVVSVKVPS